MFKVIKLRTGIIFVLVALFGLAFSFGIVAVASNRNEPSLPYKIVVDAGHGGIDAGCEGSLEGSNERELNLLYANSLKKYLETYGIEVVMTRTTTDGLYSAFAPNKKKDDMKKRENIINNANADLVVSIHMNAYPTSSVRGAQVFYNPESEVSENLALSIQNCFIADLPEAKDTTSVGDYYILNCTSTPAVIVECGFLTNPEEEILLMSSEYREKLCYSIFCGIVKYLG